MLAKKFTPKRTVCKVTFSVPSEIVNEEVAIAGDFNDWDPTSTKLEQKNGEYKTELRLKPNSEYKFKYLIDGEVWENDYRQHIDAGKGTIPESLLCDALIKMCPKDLNETIKIGINQLMHNYWDIQQVEYP